MSLTSLNQINKFLQYLNCKIENLSPSTSSFWDNRGNFDASVNTFPSANGSGTAGVILANDIYLVTVAGAVGTETVNPGDHIRALVDSPGQTATNWTIIKTNIDNAIIKDIINYSEDATVIRNSTGDMLSLFANGIALNGYQGFPNMNLGIVESGDPEFGFNLGKVILLEISGKTPIVDGGSISSNSTIGNSYIRMYQSSFYEKPNIVRARRDSTSNNYTDYTVWSTVKNLDLDSFISTTNTNLANKLNTFGGLATEIPFLSSPNTLTTNSNFVFDGTNTRIGIGTNSPQAKLHILTETATLEALIECYANTPSVQFNRADGTKTIPLPTASGQYLGQLSFNSFDATNLFTTQGTIGVIANGTQTTTSKPTRLLVELTATDTATRTTHLTITGDGGVSFGADTTPNSRFNIQGGYSVSSIGSVGAGFVVQNATYNENTDAGAIPTLVSHSFSGATHTSNNAISATDLVGVVFGQPTASTNVTATNVYSVALTNMRVNGNIDFSNANRTIGTRDAFSLAIKTNNTNRINISNSGAISLLPLVTNGYLKTSGGTGLLSVSSAIPLSDITNLSSAANASQAITGNSFWASPSGASGVASYRALVANDLPTSLNNSGFGIAPNNSVISVAIGSTTNAQLFLTPTSVANLKSIIRNGDIIYTDTNDYVMTRNLMRISPTGLFFHNTSIITVSNTVTATTLLDAGTLPFNNKTIAANGINRLGTTIIYKFSGIYSNTAVAVDITITASAGVGASCAFTGTFPAVIGTNLGFSGEILMTFVGTNLVTWSGNVLFERGVNTVPTILPVNIGAATTFTQTIANTINLTATWGAANPGNSISIRNCQIFIT